MRLNEIFSVGEDSAQEIERPHYRASRLRQSILKRAFEGKLVPQDPNDEPASVLLERIRAERAQESNSKIETQWIQEGPGHQCITFSRSASF